MTALFKSGSLKRNGEIGSGNLNAPASLKNDVNIVGFHYRNHDNDLVKHTINTFKNLEAISLDIQCGGDAMWLRFTPFLIKDRDAQYNPCLIASSLEQLQDDEYKTKMSLLMTMRSHLGHANNGMNSTTQWMASVNPAHWSMQRTATTHGGLHPQWMVTDLRGLPVAGYSNIDGESEWFAYISLTEVMVAKIKQLKAKTNAK